jgi:hypothetical protein
VNKAICVVRGLALLAVITSSASAQTVKGTGIPGRIPVWAGTRQLGDSVLFQTGGQLGIGTQAPQATLDVFGANTQGFTIRGINTSKIGQASGGYFQTDSESGLALAAISTTTVGQAVGIFAQTSCPSCAAVTGQQLATTGFGGALTGSNASSDGVGVVGRATSATGFAQGIFGETNSPNGIVALLRSRVAGGNILIGQVGIDFAATDVFRVDSTGKGFFDGGTQVGGADFAESITIAKEQIQQGPGDLLVVDTTGSRRLKLTKEPYSTLVAGIYSTKPGVLARNQKMNEAATNQIPLAIVGIVPCKVSAENGAILPGDLLVSSSTPGHAMKGTDRNRMLGTVVGKALEPMREGKGVIEVLVTLQ